MPISTQNTVLGKFYDFLGINRKFHKYSESSIDMRKNYLVSPCDATLEHIGVITSSGSLIGKHGKKVSLERIYGERMDTFAGYQYISLYLSPKDRHFFTAPDGGVVSYTRGHDGDTVIPYIMALEKIGIPVFKEYIEHNAAVGWIIESGSTTLGMIAFGSLNVNRIVLDKNLGESVSRGEKIGHFLMGSGITLIVPTDFEIQKKIGESVTIGEAIIKKSQSI